MYELVVFHTRSTMNERKEKIFVIVGNDGGHGGPSVEDNWLVQRKCFWSRKNISDFDL